MTQGDMFAVGGGTDTAPEGDEAFVPVHELPALVRHITEHWPSYVAAIHAAEAAVKALESECAEQTGLDCTVWHWDPLCRQSLEGLARSSMMAVASEARRTFCRGDESVFGEYDATAMIDACGALADPQRPDFEAFWRAVESKFGGGAGERQARQIAARKVRTALCIWSAGKNQSWRGDPVMERGGVTFTLGVRPMEREKGYDGKARYRVSYYGEREFRDAVGAVADVLELEFRPYQHYQAFSRYQHGEVKPPVRFEAGGCRWTMTTNDLRLWMPQEMALSLRAKLDEYDPEG